MTDHGDTRSGTEREGLDTRKIEAAVKWLRGRLDEWQHANAIEYQPNRTNAVTVHAPHVVTLLAALGRAEAERDEALRDFADELVARKWDADAAEARLAAAEAIVEAAERADLDYIIGGLMEQGETISAVQLSRIRDAAAALSPSTPKEATE